MKNKKHIKSLCLYLLLGAGIAGCSPAESESEMYQSSAEPELNSEIAEYSGHHIVAEAIRNISREKSRTGHFAVKLDSINKYGFKTDVINLKKGAFVSAAVWQHQSYPLSGFFCVLTTKNSHKVIAPNTFTYCESQWNKLTHEIYVSDDSTKVEFYVFSGGDLAYFDDLKIRKYQSVPIDTTVVQSNAQVQLIIPTQSIRSLKSMKKKALAVGVIGENEKKWVAAYLLQDSDSIPIEMRLKGDWTDHLNSGKDSYRIKVKGKRLFNGMKSFSIQHPKTRHYMHEWWMHQLCEKEALLSTKYDFVSVSINKENRGVFAIEEHFEKELLLRQNRVEGPILKMDESGLWEHTFVKQAIPGIKAYPIFKASVILPFKQKKTFKSELLRSQFYAGVRLLELHKALSEAVDDIFDIDQVAKYYALLELGNVQHGHQWHNKRFYYNPQNQKLESIAFDLNAGHGFDEALYILKKLRSKSGPMEWQLILPLLKNVKFKNAYLQYLNQFSEPSYLDAVFEELNEDIASREKLLGLEIDSYRFDKKLYKQRAKKIREDLSMIDSIWNDFLSEERPLNNYVKKVAYQTETDPIVLLGVSLNAYLTTNSNGKYSLKFENYHLNTIEVIGFETNKGKKVYFETPILMPRFSSSEDGTFMTAKVNKKPSHILFTAANVPGKVFKKKILGAEK